MQANRSIRFYLYSVAPVNSINNSHLKKLCIVGVKVKVLQSEREPQQKHLATE